MIAKIYSSRPDFKSTTAAAAAAPGRNTTAGAHSKPTEVSSRSPSPAFGAAATQLTDTLHAFYAPDEGEVKGRLDPPADFDNSPPTPVLSPPTSFIEHDASLCRSGWWESNVPPVEHEHALFGLLHCENGGKMTSIDDDTPKLLTEDKHVYNIGTYHAGSLGVDTNVGNGLSISPPSPTPSQSTDSLSDVSLILDSLDELLVSNEDDHCWLDFEPDANHGDQVSSAKDNLSNHSFEVKVRLEVSPNPSSVLE